MGKFVIELLIWVYFWIWKDIGYPSIRDTFDGSLIKTDDDVAAERPPPTTEFQVPMSALKSDFRGNAAGLNGFDQPPPICGKAEKRGDIPIRRCSAETELWSPNG